MAVVLLQLGSIGVRAWSQWLMSRTWIFSVVSTRDAGAGLVWETKQQLRHTSPKLHYV